MIKRVCIFMMIAVLSIWLVSCDEITPEVKQYNISYVANSDCNISLSKELASVNEEIEVSVTNMKDGLVLDKITANDMTIDNNKFLMPSEDVVVKVYLTAKENKYYNVIIIPSEFAIINTHQQQYSVGSNVQLEYQCKGHYVLDSFYINGVAISGTSFKMPESDVVITASFKNALPNTDWQLAVESGTNVGRSYWYFKYEETGLAINVKVDDRLTCGWDFSNDMGWQDNIEIILSPKTNDYGWNVNKSVKILVSCTNQFFVQKATEPNVFTTVFDFENKISVNAVERSLNNNDGYNGYEVNMWISYEYLSLTKEEAIDNISACLAMRNTNSFGATVWNYYGENGVSWENANTHPIILSNGKLSSRR